MKKMWLPSILIFSLVAIIPVHTASIDTREAIIMFEEELQSTPLYDEQGDIFLLEEADEKERERVEETKNFHEQVQLEQERLLQEQILEQERREQIENEMEETIIENGMGIVIPDGLGDLYTVSCYGTPGFFILNGSYTDGSWHSIQAGTQQERVHNAWINAGSQFADGIAVMDGRYLIATTSTFGTPGDLVTFYLEDGTGMPCIIADQKAQEYCDWDHNPANMWGHNGGRSIVEFEVDKDYFFRYGNPGSQEWHPELMQRVKYAVKEGSLF